MCVCVGKIVETLNLVQIECCCCNIPFSFLSKILEEINIRKHIYDNILENVN